jgi:hypothetical protein
MERERRPIKPLGIFVLIILGSLSVFGIFNEEPTVEEGSTIEASVKNKDPVIFSAGWSDEKYGVRTSIHGGQIVEKEDVMNGPYKEFSLNYKIENKSNKTATTYVNQGKLIINGKQYEANIFESDNLGGEILNGVTKEGRVIYHIDHDLDVKSIKEIRLAWSHFDYQYDIKLNLQIE